MRTFNQCRVIKNGQRCCMPQYVNGICRNHALEIRAKPNSSTRIGKNPLDPEEANWVDAYLTGNLESTQDLDQKLRELPVEAQQFNQVRTWTEEGASKSEAATRSMFPHKGRPDKDYSNQRITQALQSYDLVARVAKLAAPSPEIGQRPLSDPELVDYIVRAAQLSLDEAKQVLAIMKSSVTGGTKGVRRAMQPSSALTKTIKTRKLMSYTPSPALVKWVNKRDVLILISPEHVTPRVMTWRGGAHIDADLTSTDQNDLSPLVAKAIQASLLWMGSKPGRTKGTKIVVARIGQPDVRLVWEAGEPLNLATIRANWGRLLGRLASRAKSVLDADAANYAEKMTNEFGTVNMHKKRRGRPTDSTKYRAEDVGPFDASQEQEQEGGPDLASGPMPDIVPPATYPGSHADLDIPEAPPSSSSGRGRGRGRGR